MLSNGRMFCIFITGLAMVMCLSASACAEDAPPLSNKGLELQKAGKWAEAMKVYEEELKSNPTDVKALFGLGTVYYSMREFERAAAAFQNVLGLKENSTRCKLYIALCKLHMGLPQEASNDLQRILIDHPGNATAMLALGVAEVAAGYPNTAIDTFRKTLDLRPGNAAFRETVQRMMNIANRYADAKEQLSNLSIMSNFNNVLSEAALATRGRLKPGGQGIAANLSSAHRMAVLDAMFFSGDDEEGAQRVRPDFLKESDDR